MVWEGDWVRWGENWGYNHEHGPASVYMRLAPMDVVEARGEDTPSRDGPPAIDGLGPN